MKKEGEDDDGDDDHLFDESRSQRPNRGTNQIRAVVGHDQLDAIREPCFDLREALFYCVDDSKRVLAVSHHDDPTHDLTFSIEFGNAASHVRSDRDLRNVLKVDGYAIRAAVTLTPAQPR